MYRRGLRALVVVGWVGAGVAASPGACAASSGQPDETALLQSYALGHGGVASIGLEAGCSSCHWPASEDKALAANMTQEDLSSSCSTVFLSAWLDLGKNFVHNSTRSVQDFSYIEKYYRSILALRGSGVRSVIIHNNLSTSFTDAYSTSDGAVSFAKADLSKMNKALHPVEWRLVLMFEQIRKHPDWDTVFLTDINDVIVHHNPCHFVDRQPGKVFVQIESWAYGQWLPNHYYQSLGGKYLDWYMAQPHDYSMRLLNAGVFGGKRGVVHTLADKFEAALLDPNLAIRQGKVPHDDDNPYFLGSTCPCWITSCTPSIRATSSPATPCMTHTCRINSEGQTSTSLTSETAPGGLLRATT